MLSRATPHHDKPHHQTEHKQSRQHEDEVAADKVCDRDDWFLPSREIPASGTALPKPDAEEPKTQFGKNDYANEEA
jgi:hypothetical protein